MFLSVRVTTFLPSAGTPIDEHLEVLRTAAIVRVRPLVHPGLPAGACKVTVAEVGDLIVLEAFPAFCARLYRAVGHRPVSEA